MAKTFLSLPAGYLECIRTYAVYQNIYIYSAILKLYQNICRISEYQNICSTFSVSEYMQCGVKVMGARVTLTPSPGPRDAHSGVLILTMVTMTIMMVTMVTMTMVMSWMMVMAMTLWAYDGEQKVVTAYSPMYIVQMEN